VSRQDERESELRDENSKLHTKYSEVISSKYIIISTTTMKFVNLECNISLETKLISDLQ